MHQKHSIGVSETRHGEHAILIKLAGMWDSGKEPVLRCEFSDILSLVRERHSGVILDLRRVCLFGGAVLAQISSFAGLLEKDDIRLIVVPPRDTDCIALILGVSHGFDAMVPTTRAAKEMPGISDN